ncbi:MAG: BRCT domain-containing protein [Gammaproteobacteria bacterium]|nr:BRCT domain-containing protein [Gammaproteobacteria bacterium]
MSPTHDRDGQPAPAFNTARNRRRAVHALLGICRGIAADGKLVDDEILFLDIWLRDHGEHLRHDPDARDLIDITTDILEDGRITDDERADLLAEIETILEVRDDEADDPADLTNHLLGLLSGVAADGKLHPREIHAIRDWLSANPFIAGQWPAHTVRELLTTATQTAALTDDDRARLLAGLRALTGKDTDGSADGLSTTAPINHFAEVIIANRNFCLTGKFLTGPRSACESAIAAHGGNPKANVNSTIDYLVIGTLVSRDWRFTSYGRKIEAAVELHRSKGKPLIISEAMLFEHIRDS